MLGIIWPPVKLLSMGKTSESFHFSSKRMRRSRQRNLHLPHLLLHPYPVDFFDFCVRPCAIAGLWTDRSHLPKSDFRKIKSPFIFYKLSKVKFGKRKDENLLLKITKIKAS